MSIQAPPGVRRLFAVTAAAAVVYVAALCSGHTGADLVNVWLLVFLLVAATASCAWRAAAVAQDRWVWWLMAVGLGCWAGAEVVYPLFIEQLDPEPYPSVADALWLAEYPTAGVALALLLRSRVGRLPVAYAIDALLGAVAAAAVEIAVLGGLPAVDGESLAVLVNAAYPVGDLLLLVLLASAFALGRFSWSSAWGLLAVAFAAQIVSDSLYLSSIASTGAYDPGAASASGWYLSAAAVTFAAWRPAAGDEGRAGWSSVITCAAGGVSGLVLLVIDHFDRLPTAAVVLAGLTVALVILRLGLVFRENLRLLGTAQVEAETDALTGLGNRRSLLVDLERAACDRPGMLALYDLDGFKVYNDTFGHPAGDELLRRLGARLSDAAQASGARAYRLGGDEFCVVGACMPTAAATLAEEGVLALREAGEGFSIGASCGWTRLPLAGGAVAALKEADARMYAAKHAGRTSTARQTAQALLAAVAERHPMLGDHAGEVTALSVAVAEHLGLTASAIELVRVAAELHDIGKIAIPEQIIDKPGPLDDEEWRFMRRHTVIGERILLAAPDLRAAAPLVRASHERWDGMGYPDGVAGAAIPLGARIVTVCDAYDAMVGARPYRPTRTHEEALAELRRCAGSHFDPGVVDAFVAVMAALPAAA